MQVYVNGEFVHRDRATVSVFDSGYVCGDGVWEGLRLVNGKLIALQAHLDRLFAGAPAIQLNIWDGDEVQSPSRYLIATVEELDSQLWTVNSIKPNTDSTQSLTLSEYSDAIYP